MRMQSVGNATFVIVTFKKFVCDQTNNLYSHCDCSPLISNLNPELLRTTECVCPAFPQTRPPWEAENFSPLTYPNNSSHLPHKTTGPQTTTPIPYPLPTVTTPEPPQHPHQLTPVVHFQDMEIRDVTLT